MEKGEKRQGGGVILGEEGKVVRENNYCSGKGEKSWKDMRQVVEAVEKNG